MSPRLPTPSTAAAITRVATLPVNPTRSEGMPRSRVIAGRFNDSSVGSTAATTNGIEVARTIMKVENDHLDRACAIGVIALPPSPVLTRCEDSASYAASNLCLFSGNRVHEASPEFPRMSLLGFSVNRGNPPTFLVGKESSSYLSLLLWLLFLREQDVVDRDVHLRDPQAGQVLHPVYHIVAHGLGGPRDLPTVLHGQREIGGSLLQHPRSHAQLFARREVPSAPRPQMREDRHEGDGLLGEAVDGLLLVARVVRPGYHPLPEELPHAVGQDVGGDALLRTQELAEVALAAEHHVAEDQQTPFVAEHLQREVDRAPRAVIVAFHPRSPETVPKIADAKLYQSPYAVTGCKRQ